MGRAGVTRVERDSRDAANVGRHPLDRIAWRLYFEEKDLQETRGQLDKVLAGFPWLKPAAAELFGGKFDPARLTFPHNLIPAMKHMPLSDIRDWDAIRSWATGLARTLVS